MLTVHHQASGRDYCLPKERLQRDLPESLFAETLQVDPEATEMTLSHLDVTAENLQLITNWLQDIEPLSHQSSLKCAHRYLNIPRLLVYADPLYDRLGSPQTWYFLDPEISNITSLHPAITMAIQQDSSPIIQYCLDNNFIPRPQLLLEAVRNRATKVVQVLLSSEHIDPNYMVSSPLMEAVKAGYTEIVALLLADPRTDVASNGKYFLEFAVMGGHSETAQLLLADTRIGPIDMGQLMGHARQSSSRMQEVLRNSLQTRKSQI